MITFDEAIALTLGLAQPLGPQTIPIEQAAGRILAAPLIARDASPRAAVSAMDGYAVRSADLTGGQVRLRQIGQSFPGAGFDGTVRAGETVRIFTGGPVPAGADRIVIQEVVRREGHEAVTEDDGAGPSYVRPQGSDFKAGAVLLNPRRRLDPRAMVAAGAADRSEVEVFRRPGVIVIGTGDELLPPGSAHTTRFGIPESVSLGVAALATAWGGVCLDRRRLTDDLMILKAAARDALGAADVVVITGGASVGDRDFARAMFEDCGLELVFSKVEIKPGKPMWLGKALGKLVMGLPGNPTSALVTARLFLAPLLAGLSGGDPFAATRSMQVQLVADLPDTGDRETFYRARWSGRGVAPFDNQDSGAQDTLAHADVLIRRPANMPGAPAGQEVQVIEFDPGGFLAG